MAGPNSLDQAQKVISGTFTAIGPSATIDCWGNFNVLLWGSVSFNLTTTNGSATATASSATGLAVGQSLSGNVHVPIGTTIGALSGTTITLAFPTGTTAAQVTAGSTIATTAENAAATATVNLERSFDGGVTWITCGVGGAGQTASYSTLPISIVGGEPEKVVLYRLNCVAYTSGTVNYRLSTPGTSNSTWGVPPGFA